MQSWSMKTALRPGVVDAVASWEAERASRGRVYLPTNMDAYAAAFSAMVGLRASLPNLRVIVVARDDDELVGWRRAVDVSVHGPALHEIHIRRASQSLHFGPGYLLHICSRAAFFGPTFAHLFALGDMHSKRPLLLVAEESVVRGYEAQWDQATNIATYWLLLTCPQLASPISARHQLRPTTRSANTSPVNGKISTLARQDVSTIVLRQDLRPWQREAVAVWEGRGQRGIVQAVTGAGKTMLALGAIERCLSRHPDTVVQIIVPTIVLMQQWYSALQERLGLWAREIGLSGGGYSDDPWNRRVLIYVANSARGHLPRHAAELRRERPKLPILLIADECHRLGSPENAKALRGNPTWTLGLSATPQREGDFGFERVLEPELGRVVFRYGYARALKEGSIHPFSVSYVLVDLSPDEQQRYLELSDTISTLHQVLEDRYPSLRRPAGGKYIAELNGLKARCPDDSDIERMQVAMLGRTRLLHLARNKIGFIDRLAAHLPRSDKTIVFHQEVGYVEAVSRIFARLTPRRGGILVHHSRLPKREQGDALRRFRREPGAVMLTAHTLEEGIDVADASVAILLASSGSGRQKIQRIGRVLRPADGKAQSRIVVLAARDTTEDPLAPNRRTDAFFEAIAEVAEPAMFAWPGEERAVIAYLTGGNAPGS